MHLGFSNKPLNLQWLFEFISKDILNPKISSEVIQYFLLYLISFYLGQSTEAK